MLYIFVMTIFSVVFAYEKDMTFSVQPGKMDCFFQKVSKDEIIDIEYQVIDATHGELDISFQLGDPNGRVLVTDYKKPENSHRHTATEEGDYRFCFDNTFSTFSEKTVFFDVMIDNEETQEKDYEDDRELELGKDAQTYFMRVRDISESVVKIKDNVSTAKRLQELHSAHEARDRNLAEEMCSRVMSWSLLQIVLMLLVGITQHEIHRLLSRAVYVTGQPLSLFDHQLWKEGLHALNPNYNPPTRKMMATTLLDVEYNDVRGQILEKISQAKVLHLAVDGWSNVRNDSILNIIIYTPQPFFHQFLETKTQRHTAEFLSEELSKILEDLGVEKFVAIVTDNAANMVKCGRILSNKYDNILWIGCAAHTLNLLIGDILKNDTIKEIFSFIVSIVKSVTQSHLLNAEFKKVAHENSVTVSLILPVKTRWGSYLHCIENFRKSKSLLQILSINENNREMLKYKNKILDEATWVVIERHAKIFKPTVDWITKLEADDGKIHLVHQAFTEIEEMLNSENAKQIFGHHLEEILAKFTQRKQNALKSVHFAAAILDPGNQGTTLPANANLEGCQAIMNIAQCGYGSNGPRILEDLANYKGRTGIYDKSFLWESACTIQPLSWWNLFFPNSDLGRAALKILSIPSTSATVERSFSTFSNIHTQKRNKLKTDRAGKLCYVAHNWKLMNKTPKSSNRTQTQSYQSSSIIQSSATSANHESDSEQEESMLESVETFDFEEFQDIQEEPLLLEDPLSID